MLWEMLGASAPWVLVFLLLWVYWMAERASALAARMLGVAKGGQRQ